jgi:hypothetical protein
VVGDLSSGASSRLEQIMSKIARATGLSIERSFPPNTIEMLFVFDKRAIVDLHEKPERLHFYGLNDRVIKGLQQKLLKPAAEGGAECNATAFESSGGEISYAVGLSQNASDKCVSLLAFASMGVIFDKSVDIERGYKMACLLYRARLVGAKTLNDITMKEKELVSGCRNTP